MILRPFQPCPLVGLVVMILVVQSNFVLLLPMTCQVMNWGSVNENKGLAFSELVK